MNIGAREVIKTRLDLKMRGRPGGGTLENSVIGPGRVSNHIRTSGGGKAAQPTIINNKYG